MGSRSADRSGDKADAIRKGTKIRRKRTKKRTKVRLAAFTHGQVTGCHRDRNRNRSFRSPRTTAHGGR